MNKSNIEGIYPLSPLQEGMLFHTLYTPDSRAYFQQFCYVVHGPFNVAAFEQAWQQIVDRHGILRTAFIWEREGKPLQVVLRRAKLPLEQLDWRSLTPGEHETQLAAYLRADRNRGFDVTQAPLMRLALLRVGEHEYQFIWSHHHLLLDGWSVSQLMKELFVLYEAFDRGVDAGLESVPPFKDYITWLQQQEIAKAEKFWRQEMQGFSAPTPFRVDRTIDKALYHKEGKVVQEKRRQIILPAATTAALHTLAKRHRLSLNTLFQGVWALLLKQYSGEKDVVFGASVSGRPPDLVGVESMVGLFINTLPVRIQVPGMAKLLPWLEAIQTQQVEARQYKYTPLVQIQSWSVVPRGAPLFESILIFENFPWGAPAATQEPSLDMRPLHSAGRTSLPLALVVEPSQELSISIHYNPQRFEADTITRMLGHICSLLEGMIVDPQRRLADLPLLTQAEQHQLTATWNETRTDYLKNRCLHELFEAQVEQRPDAVTAIFKDATLTCEELNRRANQLAHYLQARGVRRGTVVGLCVERSLEMLVGLLGILKAGGTYLPLDPAYPKERLAYVLEDAKAFVLLTQSRLLDGLSTYTGEVVCLDTAWKDIACESETSPDVKVSAQDLAYVIYTSGSTGKPKGVQVLHRAVVNFLHSMRREPGFTAQDILLAVTTLSFDIAGMELFLPLTTGGQVVLVNHETAADGVKLAARLTDSGATIMQATPVTWRLLLESDWSGDQGLKILCGGEAFPRDLANRLVEKASVVWNMYGPTETTIWSAICRVEAGEGLVSIGRPIANTQTYLLDQYLNPVPVGVVGELYIGGDGLARGYSNRPSLTAEKFVPNPFSFPFISPTEGEEREGERLYRTGDLARYLPDGNIECLGRSDHQVKVRGFRVELGDIEAALGEHAIVQETVVMAREDLPGNKRLVAYVIPGQGPSPTVSELRRFLKGKLPDYMIPSAFVMLEALPLTPNGKIDRRALPAPGQARPKLEEAFVAPRTAIEETLTHIWTKVLRLERVGIHDNFFALGGDSILSVQIVARARQAGLHITPKQVFDQPTIAKLAAVVTTVGATQADQGPVTGVLPLTPIQRWFFEQNLTAFRHFNEAILLKTRQTLDTVLLEQAVRHLLAHHDGLRLRFAQGLSGWQQEIVAPTSVNDLIRVDLSALPEPAQVIALERHAAALHASLNLSTGPLVRVGLFDLGAHEPDRLLLIIHHLAVDGVSWRILLEDLQTIYQQLSRGETVQLPLKTTSYKHWAEQLATYAQSAEVRSEIDYWLTKPSAQAASIPRDYTDGVNTFASAQSVTVSLDVDQTRALLRDVPGVYRTQINDVLLTALALTFKQWTGSSVLPVSLESHGRQQVAEDVDLSRTVGWFTSLFPTLLDLGDATEPGEALKAVKEQMRRIPNHGIGYGVLRYLGDEKVAARLGALPQPEVNFNFLDQFDQTFSPAGLFALADESSGPPYDPHGRRSHILEIVSLVQDDQLQVGWTFSQNLHRAATIERLAQEYLATLQALIDHCQSAKAGGYTPSDFPLAGLDQATLEHLFGHHRHVEDVYPLSPMQESMLSHALYDLDLGVGFEHMSLRLQGELDVAAFKRAWQRVVERHPIIRTAFLWADVNRPLQIVYKKVQIPWEQQDWRGQSPQEQQKRLESFLQADRQRGFDMSCAPLTRMALIRITDDAYQFVWSVHHALIDGWCQPLIFQEVMAFYEAFCQGQDVHLPSPPPYRDYIAWLQQQNLDQAEVFWRRLLSGFTVPTPLQVHRSTGDRAAASEFYQVQDIVLAPTITTALQTLARQEQLTLNTILQGAWALLLSHYSGEDDVVFGITVSGRPPALPNVESMIGIFINNLPVRVEIEPHTSLGTWLKHIQDQQIELRQYEHTPLVQIRQWADVPLNLPLFESLLVFENYPVEDSLSVGQSSNLIVNDVYTMIRTNYPLTLVALPGAELWLGLTYDSQRFDAAGIGQMLKHLQALLENMAAAPEQCLSSTSFLTKAERQQLTHAQLYVLNARQQPVPTGVAGELYVRDPSQAQVLLNYPDLTADQVIPHPFDNESGASLYGTGELARYRFDGQIELLGRLDRQVKIHGYRAVLADIEAVLNRHPAVLASAVMLRDDLPFLPEQKGGAATGLAAYLVTRDAQAPAIGELRGFLKEQLFEHMLPSIFVSVDALPLTPHGRVDYRALPAPDQARGSSLMKNFNAANDPFQVLLTQIWEEILDIQPIGGDDDFFDLGGNSILALHLVTRIKQQLGVDLPLATLFQGTTVRRMGALLRQGADVAPWSALVPIKRSGSRRPFFCVHPAGGSILGFVDLARCLDPEQPFYGLQSVGLDGQRQPYTCLRDMAAYYIAEIRSVQPEGPYALGGLSFGGFVAFEMAQQLWRAGQQIKLLAMLDTWSPYFCGKPALDFDGTRQLIDVARENAGAHSQKLVLSYDKLKLLEPNDQVNCVLEQMQATDAFFPGTGPAEMRRLLKLYYSNSMAMQNYTPQVYPGCITLFRAAALNTQYKEFVRHPAIQEPTRGWNELSTQPIEVCVVPGDHATMMFVPHVRELAAHLTACLNRVPDVMTK